jgi:dienelactone hydrolase
MPQNARKTSWSVTLLILFFVIFFAIFFVIGARAEKQDVTFRAADGFTLKGTFYSAEKPGPGLLLLHQCDGNRLLYDHLATMLNTAGYNVLTFDFRGFGGSQAGEYTDFTAQRQKIMDQMPSDVEAALSFLTSHSTVNPRALGIVAGNCAVNQAVHAARRHPAIRTLVLLSGGTDAEGEAYIKDSPKVPILGVASDEDSGAAAATKKLVALSTNSDSQLEMFTNAGHAALIFAKQPDLEPDIVIWFISNLPLAGYGLPPAIQ